MYCSGPSESYGKNASSERIIAEPPRNIGPAGAIRIHFFPKHMKRAAITNSGSAITL